MTDSSETNWDSRICNEKSGFLFDHHCGRSVAVSCARCSKPVCNDHFREADNDDAICISCAKTELTSLGRDQKTSKRGYGRHSRWRDDDPYFYGGYHYVGWGHYGHGYWGHSNYLHATNGDTADFTEADSGALSAANADDDAGDFESDMSES